MCENSTVSYVSQPKSVEHQFGHEQNTSSPPLFTFLIGLFSIFATWAQRLGFVGGACTMDLLKRSTAIASEANATN